MNCKTVCLRCDDHAETVAFCKYTYEDGDVDYEVNIVDSYCGYDLMGIKNRFKRAWKAFFAKPVCYTGVYVEDPARMKKFLNECIALMEEEDDEKNQTNN